jgi:hypothetical protein
MKLIPLSNQGERSYPMKYLALFCSIVILVTGTRCGTQPVSGGEDFSTSGNIAAAVGGALSGTISTGLLASQKFFLNSAPIDLAHFTSVTLQPWPGIANAYAADLCPTYQTSTTACVATGSTLWLTYAACSFGSSLPTWTGTQALMLSNGSAACGTFPNPGALGTLIRQFASAVSSSNAGIATHTSAYGTVTTIDHSSANLANFDGQTIGVIANNGYGAKITYNASGNRSSLLLSARYYSASNFDYSVTGTVAISEASGATTRTLSGTLVTYYNSIKLIASSSLSGVTHSDTCCQPISGTITTSLSAGTRVNPTTVGSALIGKTETLTITGCGKATLIGFQGAVSQVTLSRCF